MDEKLDLTRRKALAGLGGIGAGAALGGTGTMAFLNDAETTAGTVTAGELDLKIDWEEHYNGEMIEDQALTDNPGPIFDLGDVKPGDYGEATISLHVFDNPAWVHMAGELTKNGENGVTEPESEAAGENDPQGEDSGDNWSGELADEILVDVWYDGSDADADGAGGNNTYESDEIPIASGTLRDVMTQLENGRLLRNQAPPAAEAGAASTTNGGAACSTSDEWKIDQTPEVGDTTPNGDVEITGVETEASEVVGVEWESNSEVCMVAVKGGPGTRTYPYDCATAGGVDYAPENTGNPNRTYYEISHVQFYYCENGDDSNGDGGNGDNGNGDGDHHDGCWPNSTTQYIGFSWELPFEVGNEIQSDEVQFDLSFHAQQCRHNDDPANPYAE